MAKHAQRYDAKTKVMWLYREYDDPDTLVPSDELKSWSKAARDGSAPDGSPLVGVCYVFGHEDTAEYNHAPLQFARVGTFVGSIDDPKPFDSDEELDFATKSDFGI